MANQIALPLKTAGSRKIKIPLITAPLDTETTKEVTGFIRAWK